MTRDMAAGTHCATVKWTGGDREDIRAHTIEVAGQTVAASSAPEFGGKADRADPEELFVACFIANSVNCAVDIEARG